MLRTHEEKKVFSKKKFRFLTTIDLIECLQTDKIQKLFHSCAPISEVPSDTSIYMPTKRGLNMLYVLNRHPPPYP